MSYPKRLLCVLLILYGHFGIPNVGLDWLPSVTQEVSLAAYVYESDANEGGNSIPPYVAAGMRKISESGIDTAMVDVNVTNGKDEPVLQEPIKVAKEHGLPAIAVVRGDKAVSKDVPKPDGDFLELVK